MHNGTVEVKGLHHCAESVKLLNVDDTDAGGTNIQKTNTQWPVNQVTNAGHEAQRLYNLMLENISSYIPFKHC